MARRRGSRRVMPGWSLSGFAYGHCYGSGQVSRTRPALRRGDGYATIDRGSVGVASQHRMPPARLPPQRGRSVPWVCWPTAPLQLLRATLPRVSVAGVSQLTPSTWGHNPEVAIERLNRWLAGWHQFFGIATNNDEVMRVMRKIDAHVRRRLRDHRASLETQTHDR